MPGPVSDSYDPEFGTREAAERILDQLRGVYAKLTLLLDNKPPKPILELINDPPGARKYLELHEKELRLLRFAIERASESI